MNIQCECGKFRAALNDFPKNSPGRFKCYCDDCQSYLHHIQRADLLDECGGTEIIPAYPRSIEVLSGQEHLQCIRLSEKGMYRFLASCCRTPICNTAPGRPWAGIHRRVYPTKELDAAYPKVTSSIMGKYAKGTPPPGTPKTFDFNGMKIVMPYLLRGKFTGKAKHSPFFKRDGKPIAEVKVLTQQERTEALRSAGFV